MPLSGLACCGEQVQARADYGNDANLWFIRDIKADKITDCFYIHPTTVMSPCSWNAKRDGYAPKGDVLPDFMDPDLLVNQAGAFADCNIWAPRYSQVGMMGLIKCNLKTADKALVPYKAALMTAYADVKAAFQVFLETRDKQRPFIIAAHSQGSFMAAKVIASLEGTAHLKQFVAGYLAGGYIPTDLFGTVFKDVQACSSPTDTRCLISWDTRVLGKWTPDALNTGMLGMHPHLIYWDFFDKYCERSPSVTDDKGKDRLQINPLTWTSNGGGVHLGVKLAKSTEPQVPPEGYGGKVEVTNNAVLIEDPKPWYTEYPGSAPNFHPKDVQFFFFNIKENVPKRVEAWQRKQ